MTTKAKPRTTTLFASVAFTTSGALPSAAALAALKARFRAVPPDYEAFLRSVNGGMPARCLFRIGKGTSLVDSFTGLGTGHAYNDLERKLQSFVGRIPTWAIPCAYDEGGNQVLLSTRPDDFGVVYFWSHDAEGDEGPEGSVARLPELAPSFTAFVESLRPEEEIDDPPPPRKTSAKPRSRS